MSSPPPPFIELAEIYLNLDQLAFIRTEEHAHLGTVLAIHFATPGQEPLYIGAQHAEELRSLLGAQSAPTT